MMNISEQLKQKLKENLIDKKFHREIVGLVQILERVCLSTVSTIKNIETSIENIGRLDEEIASQVYRMLKIILDEVAKISEYSKFKYGDIVKELIRINLFEGNGCRIESEVAIGRIKSYIYEIAYSVENKGIGKKEIENQLSINNIINYGIDFEKLRIEILKIEQEKPKYYRWDRLAASSAQGYVTYVMFAITIIKYFNNVTLPSEKMKEPIFFFLDNPFSSASDIELWEPVRRFLDKSNAQLLCVAHKVPGAAQILFDRHILIEQTKNSNGQLINSIRNEKVEAKEIIQMNVFDHVVVE